MTLHPDQPIAGILAPLFALRGEGDLGIGDLAALRQLIDWAAENGFKLAQLLPVNETGNDNSPYNAISSVAIEPTTLCITPGTVPDLTPGDMAEIVTRAAGAGGQGGVVDYKAVKPLKRALLERAFQNFSANHLRRNTSRARAFREFMREEHAWIQGYALFRALMDENGGSERWDHWPEEQRTMETALAWLAKKPGAFRKAFESRMRFFMYTQWNAFTQWRQTHEYASQKGVALMGDVPYGLSLYSADVFSEPGIFNMDWSGGAPPEPYFKDDAFSQKWGQNWGVPLYRWDVMRRDGFAWWRRRVRMVREIFHLFRIDHILGFYRIYSFPWRPDLNASFLPLSPEEARSRTGGALPHFTPRDDSSWENAEANRVEGEEYLKALLAETGEYRLVGEDLGMVPPYVRPSLTSIGIAGFKIPQWEKGQDGHLLAGESYQRLSVTTYATHDHEPLRVMWRKWFEAAQRDGNGDALNEMREMAAFAKMEGTLPQPWSDAVHEKLLEALFKSNAWIAICMVTDLFATEQRFNVPGAVAESNWSERLPRPVSKWKENGEIVTKMEKVRQMLAATGRGS